MVVVDGESNWVEGLQLVSVYAVIALAFYGAERLLNRSARLQG